MSDTQALSRAIASAMATVASRENANRLSTSIQRRFLMALKKSFPTLLDNFEIVQTMSLGIGGQYGFLSLARKSLDFGMTAQRIAKGLGLVIKESNTWKGRTSVHGEFKGWWIFVHSWETSSPSGEPVFQSLVTVHQDGPGTDMIRTHIRL